MNRNSSTMKSIVIAAALAAAVSGLARAADSSTDPMEFQRQHFPYTNPVDNNAPSTERATPPQDPMVFEREHFPYANSVDSDAASAAAKPVFHPHDELPSVYGESSAANIK